MHGYPRTRCSRRKSKLAERCSGARCGDDRTSVSLAAPRRSTASAHAVVLAGCADKAAVPHDMMCHSALVVRHSAHEAR